ncbi:NAD-dependent epimerase/dehydratase family protein [Devosia submarina]|uniref:NAD-dependent epimerase/dehydratase family protein n=1 Tax=Devosia submarina TaxID=1173082 RepID=UPI001300898B|nr:NAD-dependent epimerase/dehydratase family protein [Devosia submarina]
MKILVTGASGFVGRTLVQTLRAAGHTVQTAGFSSPHVDHRIPLGPNADWTQALADCDAVVHAGGRAHVLDKSATSASTFDDINTKGTLRLAEAARRVGVRHFIFISSIAALGEREDKPLQEQDISRPTTPYGRSKLAAEQGLLAMDGLRVTCLRPPLVYGPDAGGRFGQMLRWCARGLPLPLAGIRNQRSFLAAPNLADAVRLCLAQGENATGIFHLADEGTLSTPELLQLIGQGLGKPARLLAIPPFALHTMRRFGLAQPIDKLSQSLVVDTSKFRAQCGWIPPVQLRDGIVDAARRYRENASP